MSPISAEENLLAFTTAARFGSFSRVIEELSLTTPVISYTIERMETRLDAMLFTHSTRSIELTESGRYFFHRATNLLNDFYATKRRIDTISQGIKARARICISQLFYTPKYTVCLLQMLKKQSPTCQITVTTKVYNGVWDTIINNQANIAIGTPDMLLDGGGINCTEIGAIRWTFAIAPNHPLAFVPEPIVESQLRLYPNIMVEDTVHTVNKKVGWPLYGQESILVPDSNIRCQCQVLGEGIDFLPDYMVHGAVTQSPLVTRQIYNPRQDPCMLLVTRHSATGQMTRWTKRQLTPNGILTGIYQDLLHWENQPLSTSQCVVNNGLYQPSAFITHLRTSSLPDTGREHKQLYKK